MSRIRQSKFQTVHLTSETTFQVTLDKAPSVGNTLFLLAYGNNNASFSLDIPTSPAGWTQDLKQTHSGAAAAACVAGHKTVAVGDGQVLTFAGLSSPLETYAFFAVWEVYGTGALAASGGVSAGSGGVDETALITPPSDSEGSVVLCIFGIQGAPTWGTPSPSEYTEMGKDTQPYESAIAVQADGASLAPAQISVTYSAGSIAAWMAMSAPAPDLGAPAPFVKCPAAPGFIAPTAQYLPYLKIPSGRSQQISELEGHSSLGSIDAKAVSDPGGVLRKLAVTQGIAGLKARLTMGFPGMDISQFQTLHTMQLASLGRDENALVDFNLEGIQRFLMKQAWVYGGPDAWSPGDPTPSQPGGACFTANDQPVSDQNPRYVQGNPMDILLVACQNELGLGQDVCAAEWRIYTPGDDSTLINPSPDLDVAGIIELRDGIFSGVRFEFKLTSAVDGKQWIEDQILKPLGLFWIEKADGRLQLKSMRQPVSTSPFTLNRDNIIGMVGASRWPINNVVKVTPKQSNGTDDADPILLIDLPSNDEFGEQGRKDYQADGMRYAWGAFALAELLADSVFRRHASQTPIYSVACHLSAVKLEVGDFVSLTHSLLLDYESGNIGVTDVLCEVIDRNPDYANASVQLKLADTRFMGFSTGPYDVAPNTTPDWTSASAAEKAQYMFISGSSGLMSDGSAGNVIF